MNRLTKRYESHISAVCKNCTLKDEFCDIDDCLKIMQSRLAAYEDTGLMPEEVKALLVSPLTAIKQKYVEGI